VTKLSHLTDLDDEDIRMILVALEEICDRVGSMTERQIRSLILRIKEQEAER